MEILIKKKKSSLTLPFQSIESLAKMPPNLRISIFSMLATLYIDHMYVNLSCRLYDNCMNFSVIYDVVKYCWQTTQKGK